MIRNKRIILIYFGTLLFLVGFQNCGTAFEANHREALLSENNVIPPGDLEPGDEALPEEQIVHRSTDGKYYDCPYDESIPFSPFVSKWKIEEGQLTLDWPILKGYDYDFEIDWGDGHMSHIDSYEDEDRSHQYSEAGTYQITVTGKMESFLGRPALVEVIDLGQTHIKTLEFALARSPNLKTFFSNADIQPCAVRSLFRGSRNVEVSIANWNTSRVQDFSFMFDQAEKANPDTSGWDTSQVVDMSYMFRRARNATPDTTHWDTSNVTSMDHMFASAGKANPNTSNWDTSRVTNMRSLFLSAGSANPDTSSWDTSAVENMSFMFRGAKLANPDTSNWDTSQVKSMQGMFQGAVNADIDTSLWDTSQVYDMNNMFSGTEKANPDTSSWDTSNVVNMSSIFREADAANPDTSNWNTSKVENMIAMFAEAFVATPKTSGWDTSQVEVMREMFSKAPLANPDTSNWDTSQVKDMSRMFLYAELANPDTSRWQTPNLINMNAMFLLAPKANPDLSNWKFDSLSQVADPFGQSGISEENYAIFLRVLAPSQKPATEFGFFRLSPPVYAPHSVKEIRESLIQSGFQINDLGVRDAP